MNWRWWEKKPQEWQITSQDVHFNGHEAQATIQDGWQPFGVTYVPNLPPDSAIYLRLWMRRSARFRRGRPILRDALGLATKPRVIRIQSAGWGGHQVVLHLSEFWTPFGVDTSPGAPDQAIIWFTKDVE